MSQKTSRKTAVNEDKEKRQTDSPVKEMKKKMAANAEKEKQAAEKNKEADKPAEKVDKQAEKTDKKVEKNTDKADKKADKNTEKVDKSAEKVDKKTENKEKTDKVDKKVEKPVEKEPEKKEESSKGEKSGKADKQEKPEQKKPEPKPKQNGNTKPVHNGVSDVTLNSNGAVDDALHGSVKATRTPETPRPASDKQTDKETDDSKEPSNKVLKLKEDAPPASDRKLRSADSPKPDPKKAQEAKKAQDAQKTEENEKKEENAEVAEKQDESKSQEEKIGDKPMEIDVVIEVESGDECRKPDTNYSKSRVKVSPYRRSMRADHTASSIVANYTGNNTTMEMDITETSSFLADEAESLNDSSYLRGLRSIRGRNSYKQLKEISLKHVASRGTKSANVSASGPACTEQSSRPTGTVVGRKRRPDAAPDHDALSKRLRLIDRLALPFRRGPPAQGPLPTAAEIVGINTDLPLTAPVSTGDTFDPETLKPTPTPTATATTHQDSDSKRCIVM